MVVFLLEFTVGVGCAFVHMEPFVLLKAVVIAVLYDLTFADSSQDVSLAAEFALTDRQLLPFLEFEGKRVLGFLLEFNNQQVVLVDDVLHS